MDTTEYAIQTFACRFGHSRQMLTKGSGGQEKGTGSWAQIGEKPFSSDLKRVTVTYREEATRKNYGLMKGAVERVLDCCHHVQTEDGRQGKADKLVERILENMKIIASKGLRELTDDEAAKAHKIDREDVEAQMTLWDLVGLYDSPRQESVGAMQFCYLAGITVHMLTGDHLAAATAIAKQIGIIPKDTSMISKEAAENLVMTASHFDKFSGKKIDKMPVLPRVIARCSPQTKVGMIEAIHRRGRLTVMTGDGVNDAPSLKLADIGIAMGLAGSEVAKDASDLTLLDDNFASITNAISEGRRLVDNIQAFVLLCQNICQAAVLLIGLVFKEDTGLSVFPLSSIEVIWVIIVTSSAPAMALGVQAARENTMQRPPAKLKRGIFINEFFFDLLTYGIWAAVLCLGTFLVCQYLSTDTGFGNNCNSGYNPSCETVFQSRAATSAVMVNLSLLLAWQLVDGEKSFFNGTTKGKWYARGWYGSWGRNPWLFVVVVGIALTFPMLYIPGLNDVVFLHKGLSWQWAVVIAVTILFFAGVKLYKYIKRATLRRRALRKHERRSADEKAFDTAQAA